MARRTRAGLGLRGRISLTVAGAVVGLSIMVLVQAPLIGELRDELTRRRGVVDSALTDVAALQSAIIDQETGQRNFLITGRREFLVPYDDGRREADLRLDRLGELGGEIEGLPAAVAAVEGSLARWQNEAAAPEIATRLETDEIPVERVLQGAGRRRFSELRQGLAELDVLLASEGRATRDRIDDALGRLLVTTLTAYGAGAVLCLAVWYLLGRWITVPVEQLVAAVERVGAGDFEHEIVIDGPTELVAVATATDSMRHEIVDRLEEANRARQALEQRAPAVIALREELEPFVPELPDGVVVATCFEPIEGLLAGDFADVLRLGPDRVAVIVADASGHGASVVMRALRVKHLLGATLAGGSGPAAALELIAPLVGGNAEGWFVSVLILIADTDGTVCWAGAGHPQGLVRTADGEVLELASTGPVLGPVPGPWTERTAMLAVPWLAVVVTDGFLEARNAEREFLGDEPIRTRLAAAALTGTTSPEELVSSLRDDVHSFLADVPPEDDLTVVAIRVEVPPADTELEEDRENACGRLSERRVRNRAQLGSATSHHTVLPWGSGSKPHRSARLRTMSRPRPRYVCRGGEAGRRQATGVVGDLDPHRGGVERDVQVDRGPTRVRWRW